MTLNVPNLYTSAKSVLTLISLYIIYVYLRYKIYNIYKGMAFAFVLLLFFVRTMYNTVPPQNMYVSS